MEDKSFWKGQVEIEAGRQKIEKLIHKCLKEQVTVLSLNNKGSSTVPTISVTDIHAMAEKCPNMEELLFCNMELVGWPSLRNPWLSMRILHINGASRVCFDNIALHESVPNIEQIAISGHQSDDPIILPDMNGCEKLKTVNLMFGCFRMPGIIPFPPGLTELDGTTRLLPEPYTRLRDCLGAIEEHCPDCNFKDDDDDDAFDEDEFEDEMKNHYMFT